jgi:hypothetical protein
VAANKTPAEANGGGRKGGHLTAKRDRPSKPHAPTRPAEAPVRFGRWTILAVDATRNRAAARCACGQVRQLAIEALQDGTAPRGCGACASSHANAPRTEVKPSFAAELSEAASRGAWKRHEGGGL